MSELLAVIRTKDVELDGRMQKLVSMKDIWRALNVRLGFKRWVNHNLHLFDVRNGCEYVTEKCTKGKIEIISYWLSVELAKRIVRNSGCQQGAGVVKWLDKLTLTQAINPNMDMEYMLQATLVDLGSRRLRRKQVVDD